MRTLLKSLGVVLPLFIVGLLSFHLFEKYLEPVGEEEYEYSNLPYQFRSSIPKKDKATPDGFWLQDKAATMDLSTGAVPVERLLVAEQVIESQLAQRRGMRISNTSLMNSNWQERGPSNVSGRTRAIMVDPNDPTRKTVFAGGVNGGIWKTNNITVNQPIWTPINDFLSILSVSWITFDPTNTSTFYATTGEGYGNGDAARGAGVFKSTDAGATWSQLPATTGFFFCQRALVTPAGTLLVATNQGVFRSTDGGGSFAEVLSNSSGTGSGFTFAYDLEMSGQGMIFASLDGSIHRSSNDGLTWSSALPLPSGINADRIELAVADNDSNYVYAITAQGSQVSGVIRSVNRGSSWQARVEPEGLGMPPGDISRGQAWYDLCIDVSPGDREVIYVGGIDLYKSDLGGAANSWTMVSQWFGGFGLQEVHADQHIIYFEPGNADVCYFGNDGGIYRTTNARAAMPLISSRKNNYNVTQFYHCALHPGQGVEYMLAGAQDNGSQRFNNAGINATFEVTGGDGAFCHIDQVNPLNQWTSYIFNSYYISNDGGNTFNSILLSDNTGAAFINPTDYDNKGGIMYCSDAPGRFFKWTGPQSAGIQSSILCSAFGNGRATCVYASDSIANRVYFGLSNGRIVRVVNFTDPFAISTPGEWLNQSSGMPSGSVSSITEDPNDPDHLLATYSNYGLASVWESFNGGFQWRVVEGNLPDVPVRTALISPINRNQAIIGTEIGVWATDSLHNAANWYFIGNAVPRTRVTQFQIRKSDNFVIASTHGRGLYSSDLFMTPFADFGGGRVAYTNVNYSPVDRSRNANIWNWRVNPGNQIYSGKIPAIQFPQIGFYSIELGINNFQDTTFKADFVKVLPDLTTSYQAKDGGNFESNPEHFGVETLRGSGFELSRSNFSGKNGTSSGSKAFVTSPLTSNYSNNTHSRIYSPTFNFTEDAFYSLSFVTKFNIDLATDGMYVEYSTDKGITWNWLGEKEEDWYNFTNTASGRLFPVSKSYFSGEIKEFVRMKQDVSFLKGNTYVAFRISFMSDGFVNKAGAVIDDFEVIKNNFKVVFPGDGTPIGFSAGVFPTLFNSSFTVNYSTEGSEPVVLQLFTVKGQLMFNELLAPSPTEVREQVVKISDLAEGMYILRISEGDKQKTIKLVRGR
jgi:hypothetical protein